MRTTSSVTGCLRLFTKLCWAGNNVNIIMKPFNSPTQGQPNPRKNRLKVAIGAATFSHSKYFFVGWDWFYIGNRLPDQILPKQPNIIIHVYIVVVHQARKRGGPRYICARRSFLMHSLDEAVGSNTLGPPGSRGGGHTAVIRK